MTVKVIIWGNSDFAELVYNYIKEDNNYEIIAFCADDKYVKTDAFCSLPLIPFSNLSKFPPSEYMFLIAVGYAKINSVRKEIFERLKNLGYKFVSYVHPSNIISENVQVGQNCILFENNIIQKFVSIEDNVFIWSNSFVGHNSSIKQHSFIAASTTIGGYSEIGEESFVGLNTTIKDKIKIGKKCLIGAGAIILKKLDDYSVNIPEGTKTAKFTSEQYLKYGFNI